MRAVDADELMELLTTAIRNIKGIAKFIGAEDDPGIKMKIKAYTDIANGVKDMPTIEPERKTGQWILADTYDGRKRYRCSECLSFALKTDDGQENLSNYCPVCGAEMKGEDDGTD